MSDLDTILNNQTAAGSAFTVAFLTAFFFFWKFFLKENLNFMLKPKNKNEIDLIKDLQLKLIEVEKTNDRQDRMIARLNCVVDSLHKNLPDGKIIIDQALTYMREGKYEACEAVLVAHQKTLDDTLLKSHFKI